jgi:hypothetical protein
MNADYQDSNLEYGNRNSEVRILKQKKNISFIFNSEFWILAPEFSFKTFFLRLSAKICVL